MKSAIWILALASVLAPARAAQQPAQPAKPAAAAPQRVELDLEDDIDDSVKFLRFTQEKDDGSYGHSVELTAVVLRAMNISPRNYTRLDGPYVTRAIEFLVARQDKDGSIHDAGADAAAIAKQTKAAAGALALFAHVSTEPALKKALAYIGKQDANATPWNDAALPEDRAGLAAMAQSLLAKRTPERAWDGAAGKQRTTADNVITLSRIHEILKPASGPKASTVKPLPASEMADREKTLAAIQRGAAWLATQGDHGKFGPAGSSRSGLTAMAIGGLLSAPEPRAKPVQEQIDQGLAWLVSLQQPDGSIHDGALANYATSASILALVRSGKKEYAPVIQKAKGFLVALQADEGEGYSPDHPYYGGNSYGDEQRPDMSNVQMALEAIAASGAGKDDPAFQRALVFLQRCQNRSESNDIHIEADGKTTVPGDDGGGTYTPGTSKAGFVELADGKRVARSYGSMSYALLKGFIFAGVPKDDPRMKACWEWLRKHYTLDVNPGFEALNEPTAAYQGLYYYFHTMAKALDLYGEETVVDSAGTSHPWRKELCGRLVSMQRKTDGSWTNENSPRWWEGNPTLATSYALVTLSTALPREK